MNKIPMTTDGYRYLWEELQLLKTVERPSVIEAIAEARLGGDIAENAEYQVAKEHQSFVEGRIAELEEKISLAEVIDITKLSGSEITFGATVTLVDEDTAVEHTYRIVGSDEADISKGLLSITSPLARALIGKQISDTIDVNAPGGSKEYVICGIKYGL
jgi:transcription elongation factor GreA